MGAIITRKQVDQAFKVFCSVIRPPEGQRWILESNGPGDGKRRYGLYAVNEDQSKGSGYYSPMQGANWTSSRAAHDALRSMAYTAQYITWLHYTEAEKA